MLYGKVRVLTVPPTVSYKGAHLMSTVRYGVPYYGTRKPYMHGYGRQPYSGLGAAMSSLHWGQFAIPAFLKEHGCVGEKERERESLD
jgi:hypothetical protein